MPKLRETPAKFSKHERHKREKYPHEQQAQWYFVRETVRLCFEENTSAIENSFAIKHFYVAL